MKNLSVVNSENGRKWNIRIVDTGDNYGLNDCLVNDDPAMVEFWDLKHSEEGQFVSRYFISTLLDGECPRGLCLDGGFPDEWSISAETMKEVVAFIKEF